ncbi:MAG: ABC transporter substrate-binding protein [Chloroflexi bacterium]|nr:ABC transporter substrate-binding protein [Chloroflexota bacterium]
MKSHRVFSALVALGLFLAACSAPAAAPKPTEPPKPAAASKPAEAAKPAAPAAPAASPAAAAPAASPAAAAPAASPAAAAPAAPAAAAGQTIGPAAPLASLSGQPPAKPAQKTRFIYSLASKAFVAGLAFIWVGSHPDVHFYQDENLDMEFVGANGAPECVQSLLAKQVDMCALVQDQVLLRAADGNKLPIKFVYDYTFKITNEFGVKPDSPIKEVKELAGKKIGVQGLGHDTFNYAKLVMTRLGLDPEKQEYIAIGQGAPAITALYNGQVDAMVAYDIEWTVYKSLGKPVRVLPQPDFIKEVKAGPIYAVRSEDVTSRPEVVGAVLRGLAKGTVFAMQNPEALLRIHWELYPESKPKGISDEEGFKQQIDVTKSRLPALDPTLADMKRWGEFNPAGWTAYVKNILGLDPAKVNPADFYTNDLIPQANNFDEAAVRAMAKSFVYKPR